MQSGENLWVVTSADVRTHVRKSFTIVRERCFPGDFGLQIIWFSGLVCPSSRRVQSLAMLATARFYGTQGEQIRGDQPRRSLADFRSIVLSNRRRSKEVYELRKTEGVAAVLVPGG